MTGDLNLILTLLIPLIGALFIAVNDERPNLREAVTLGTAAVLFCVVLWVLQQFLDGSPPAATVIPIDPTAISPGERARRMALGIELPPGEPGAAPVTRPPAVERTTSAERQQRARRQRARANRQARRTRWRQQVFRSIDLSGN